MRSRSGLTRTPGASSSSTITDTLPTLTPSYSSALVRWASMVWVMVVAASSLTSSWTALTVTVRPCRQLPEVRVKDAGLTRTSELSLTAVTYTLPAGSVASFTV